MLPTPLQVTICAKPSDRDAPGLRATITDAFRGGGSGYLSGGDDLQVPIRQFASLPRQSAERHLSGPLHCLLVVLVGRDLVADDAFAHWIDDCGRLIEAREPAHSLLLIDLDGSLDDFLRKAPHTSWSQGLVLNKLGETSVRTTIAGLIALNLAVKAVTSGASMIEDRLQFFVSHAKIDGQPLARVLADQIKDLPGFGGFYDADDIAPGANWKRVLREGVQNSVILVLLSEVYESRTWCVQEVQWAEEFASPLVVVELRHGLIMPPSRLSLDRSPTVRIPDGNIYRIIYVGLREGLRARLHMRAVQSFVDEGVLTQNATKVLVRRPSMLVLQSVCNDLRAGAPGAKTIVYPDPPLQDGEFAAANSMVKAAAPNIRLTTLQSIVASG